MKAARDAWFAWFADVRVNQLVFLDEFGATTTMQRTHGRAAPGERVVTKVPHGHWKLISTIAAMNIDGVVASGSFDDAGMRLRSAELRAHRAMQLHDILNREVANLAVSR